MQHGFRKNRSTTTAVGSLVDRILGAFEEEQSVMLQLCDLSRAFDCVSHDILPIKLKRYGIAGPVFGLLKSYLSDRRQVVSIHGATSQALEVRNGVPQGSSLGPLLFLVLMNDLQLDGKALLYADDTTLLSLGHDLPQLVVDAGDLFRDAKNWFELNHLQLNENKTQTLLCSLWNRPGIKDHSSESVKLLGLMVDQKLTWTDHVDLVCKKLSRVIFLLRKLRLLVTPEYLLMTYYALFHSHISYGIVLWGHAPATSRVLVLQKAAVRIISNSDRLEHCKPIFSQLGILTVHSQFILSTLLLLKSSTVPEQNQRAGQHNHNLRNRHDINIPRCRLKKTLENNPVLAYRLYNKLPAGIRNLDIKSIKKELNGWLLSRSFYSIDEFFEDSSLQGPAARPAAVCV